MQLNETIEKYLNEEMDFSEILKIFIDIFKSDIFINKFNEEVKKFGIKLQIDKVELNKKDNDILVHMSQKTVQSIEQQKLAIIGRKILINLLELKGFKVLNKGSSVPIVRIDNDEYRFVFSTYMYGVYRTFLNKIRK